MFSFRFSSCLTLQLILLTLSSVLPVTSFAAVPVRQADASGNVLPKISDPADASWDDRFGTLGTDDHVQALLRDNSGGLYAGGDFTTAGSVLVNHIARWDGTSWSALGSGVDDVVQALAIDADGNLYVGGRFSSAGGVSANYVAKWDGTSWSALGSGTNDSVYALAVDDGGDLYVGGTFVNAGGEPANYVAKWDGSNWSALDSGVNSTVLALLTDGGGHLYAGGSFFIAGAVSAADIAEWNGTSWSAVGSGMNNTVDALAMDGSGNLYAGGDFGLAGGVLAAHIAKWDGMNWSHLGTGMNDIVESLAVDDGGNLYAGGGFTTAGGETANYLAKWDGANWSGLGTGVDLQVQALAVGGGDLDAGGGFSTAGGNSSLFFGIWHIPTFVIMAIAGPNGSIDPSGTVQVSRGTDQTFLLTPDPGYGVIDVLVDQASVGAMTEYTFPNVTGNHIIEASFALGTDAEPSPRALVYSLKANVPNPFNPNTTIRYSLPHPSHVRLAIYDEHGWLVRRLVDAPEPAGEQATVWNGEDVEGQTVASGVYLVQLVTEDGARTRKMVLTK